MVCLDHPVWLAAGAGRHDVLGSRTAARMSHELHLTPVFFPQSCFVHWPLLQAITSPQQEQCMMLPSSTALFLPTSDSRRWIVSQDICLPQLITCHDNALRLEASLAGA